MALVQVNTLLEYIRDNPCKGFKPIPRKSKDGNFIEWYWSEKGPSYAEPVHHDGKWIGTVHRDMETKEVVGVTIHLEAIK